MSFEVSLTQAAEQDLEEIYDDTVAHDGAERAEQLLESLLQVAESLCLYPDRGSFPKELLAVGIREYRQVRPYRLIYRVLGDRIVVYLIADGRRDFQTLLEPRLLEF